MTLSMIWFIYGTMLGVAVAFGSISIGKFYKRQNDIHQQNIQVELKNQKRMQERVDLLRRQAMEKIHEQKQMKNAVAQSKLQKKTLPRENLTFLSELTRTPNIDIRVFLLDRKGKFGRNMKELFDISDAKVKIIENKINVLRERFNVDALDHAIISESSGLITIKIPAMEDGPSYYDEFLNMMKIELGSDRISEFMQLADNQIVALFDGFGSEDRTIEISFSGSDLADGPINVTEHTTSGNGVVSQWFTIKNIGEFQSKYPGFYKFIRNH